MDLYRQFLHRDLGSDREQWHTLHLPVLGALVVARGEGLTQRQLAGITRLQLPDLYSALGNCAQFLAGPHPHGPFRLFHESFADFSLTNCEYAIYPAEANQAIAEFFLTKYEGAWLHCDDDYALRYTPTHLMEVIIGDIPRHSQRGLSLAFCSLLTDVQFVEAKRARIGEKALLADLEVALELVRGASQDDPEMQTCLREMEDAVRSIRG